MVATKRKFLMSVFEREKRTMLMHYQGKKKLKKILTKFQNIKQHNLEKIVDDYFYGVCYEFYKRQMHIWILLRHKYLRNSAINIDDYRFLYQEVTLKKQETISDTSQTDIKDAEEAKFPIYFSTTESEPILRITDEINKKLEFLLRGTVYEPAVGILADNIELPDAKDYPRIKLPKRRQIDKDDEDNKAAPKVNYYKEMGLT